jgi:hypothetical protein
MALRAIADDGDLLGLNQREVGVVVVAGWEISLYVNSAWSDGLSGFDKRGQAAPGAFAKLAIAQFIGERFQVRYSVDRKVLKLCVRRVQVERGLPEKAAAYGLSQLEMIDAEQLERFLNLREETSFELDSLRCNPVVDTSTSGVEN